MLVVKSQEMRDIDSKMVTEYGLPSLLLMEHAAQAITLEVEKLFLKPSRALIAVGVGNNGGDALAVARLLHMKGWQVSIICTSDVNQLSTDAAMMYKTIKKYIAQGDISFYTSVEELHSHQQEGFSSWALCIEGLFGTGCNRVIEGQEKSLIKWINQQKMPVIAIDIPSGIHGDSGEVMGVAIKATWTICLGLPKPGNVLYPGAHYNGQLVVVDIGLEPKLIEATPNSMEIIDEQFFSFLPKRHNDSHKYTYGRVLIIAGSKEMPGAAALAALSAYRMGCGLVTVLTEDEAKNTILQWLPEAVVKTYTKNSDAFTMEEESIINSMEQANAILIGPGCGCDATTLKLMELALEQQTTVVLDADALTVLSKNLGLLENSRAHVILTPHHGEMSRLTGFSSSAVGENALKLVKSFSRQYQVITVLKGSRTLISDLEGYTYINLTGNNGLSTGGTGDVLAGMMVSLLAQGTQPMAAATFSVYCHGLAGDVASKKNGVRGMLARDVIDGISTVLEGAYETLSPGLCRD